MTRWEDDDVDLLLPTGSSVQIVKSKLFKLPNFNLPGTADSGEKTLN